jgi:phosphatidylglycerol:prolipoprotein diacylglycerol transferase
MIDFIPNPVAFQVGPIAIYWYGIGYALGLAAVVYIATNEARRMRLDTRIIPNGILVIAIAALIGGRLYHVIDQWDLYRDNPISIVLPPYTGLGAFGGLFTGLIALYLYVRHHGQSFWRFADAAAPAVFAMVAIARWGNFFNQELYGPPTNLPWGIAIDCAHRAAEYACPPGSDPAATLGQHFHPLFLYESLSGFLGMIALLWIGRRFVDRLRAGDLVLIFLIWYGLVRFGLETLRTSNWLFFGIPVAQIVSLAFVGTALAILAYRHRRPRSADDEPLPDAVAAGSAVDESVDVPAATTDDLPASAAPR